MTTVPSATGTTAATANKSATTLSSDFDDFLLLLTTQLKNQDPLDPMNSSEFTNQLVQFSQVEQQIKSNEYLETLSTYAQTSDTMLALDYVGMQIQTEGNQFKYLGLGTNISYTLPEVASKVTIKITDADGNVILTETGDGSKGTHTFAWDGKNSSGTEVEKALYKISINATNVGVNKPITVTTVVPGYVEGVTKGTDGTIALIVNNTTVPLSKITEARL